MIQQTEAMASRVWGWLGDPAHAVEGMVAVDRAGVVRGLAHYRDFARPSSASVGGYLDDLFVDPTVTGSGPPTPCSPSSAASVRSGTGA